MPIKTIRNILVAAPAVTALVGQRISPNIRAQNEARPAVVLTLISLDPSNHLAGRPTADANRVQMDVFAESYNSARTVADACRDALEAADVVMDNEFESYEDETAEYRVSQDWLVWT